MTNIREVAIRAGVSVATVSRVLNQPEVVNPETRQRVMEAVKAMNYRPNAAARSLATGKSGVVGLIVPDITNPYFGYVARGCFDELNRKGMTLALYNSAEQSSREYQVRQLIGEKQADGLIVTSEAASVSRAIETLHAVQMPTVYIERRPDGPGIDAVFLNNRQAACLAVEHLITLGHAKIAMITGIMNTMTGQDRYQGFVDAVTEAGISLPDSYIFEGNFKLEGGVTAARHIMAIKDPPTAVFVSSDLMAYGVVGELISNGWRVPEDISVIGCEDLPISQYFSPRLTTIHVPIYDLGKRAAILLAKRLEKPNRKPSVEVLNAELVVRQSTGKPK